MPCNNPHTPPPDCQACPYHKDDAAAVAVADLRDIANDPDMPPWLSSAALPALFSPAPQ